MIIKTKLIYILLFFFYSNNFYFEKTFIFYVEKSKPAYEEVFFSAMKKLHDFFSILKNFIIDIVIDFQFYFHIHFQKTVLPLIRKILTIRPSPEGDIIIFMLYVVIIFLIVVLFLEHYYYEVLSDKQRKLLINKCTNFKKFCSLFFIFFRKKFVNITKTLDDIVAANILWWGNIVIVCLVCYSNWSKTDLLLIDPTVHMILLVFSLVGILFYDPEK